jgi:hypothetical protein
MQGIGNAFGAMRDTLGNTSKGQWNGRGQENKRVMFRRSQNDPKHAGELWASGLKKAPVISDCLTNPAMPETHPWCAYFAS